MGHLLCKVEEKTQNGSRMIFKRKIILQLYVQEVINDYQGRFEHEAKTIQGIIWRFSNKILLSLIKQFHRYAFLPS